MKPEVPSNPSPPAREAISCPGCGRNDWVQWPDGQVTFAWKCFNCSKQFDLTRKRTH